MVCKNEACSLIFLQKGIPVFQGECPMYDSADPRHNLLLDCLQGRHVK